MIRQIYTIASRPVKRVVNISTFQRPTQRIYFHTSKMLSTKAEEPGVDSEKQEVKAEAKLDDDEQADVEIDPMVALQATNEALEKQVKEMRDKMLRAMADEENVRRIARRDVENAKVYANTKFAKSLLDVADNLERALEAAKPSSEEDGHKAFANLVEGVQMTHKQLAKVFESHGVVKVRNEYVMFVVAGLRLDL